MAKVVLKLAASFIELHSKGIEQLPIREGGINVAHNDHVASLIEVRDDISGLDAAVNFCVDR